jgi:hypothetical protein
MRNVVRAEELADAGLAEHHCLDQSVNALVVDIRGCKPIDPESFSLLKSFLEDARDLGVDRFVRIGDGTLCAVQMDALERAAHISDRTLVFLDDVQS